MGIYISGVKGLPEQVQENKNKIKEVEEQIEGIDFDAIRELEGQVAENTQDINNLEASIGVQNQAINNLNNDVDALESKTQKITYDEDTGKTTIDSYTIINGDLYTDNVDVAGNGTFQNANGSGLHFQEGANDDTLTIANNDGATPHYLHFNADGTLDIDGQAVGKSYYRHNISLSYSGDNYNFTFVSSKNSAYDFTTLLAYMYSQDFTSSSKNIYSAMKSSVFNLDYYYYTNQTNLYIEVFRDGSFLVKKTISSATITDSVVEI